MVSGSLLSPCFSAPLLNNHQYDESIQSSVKRYWAGYPDWKWWKAQLYQESLLEPTARSHVGAEGIAQFMPATWRQVSKQMGYRSISPRDAKYAIAAGAFYMAQLKRSWKAKRPEMDRHFLAAASYNAGMGNILHAQDRCGNKSLYKEIIACLPQVTGRHSRETITYVERIQKWYHILETER